MSSSDLPAAAPATPGSPAPDFPVALRLAGRSVLLVGAGKVAEARARGLLEAGARLHVVAPLASEGLRALAQQGRLQLSERPYRAGDCEGAALVFTAADVPEVNRAVVEEARARGVLVNAADEPALCDFFVPSVGRRGPVTLAVSTAGLAPGLARAVRQRALAAVGPEWGQLARLIGRLRRRLPPSAARTRAFESLVAVGTQLLQAGDRRTLFRLVRQLVGGTPAEDGDVPAPGQPERRPAGRSRGPSVNPGSPSTPGLRPHARGDRESPDQEPQPASPPKGDVR